MEDWKKVEALLFASGRYLSEEQISDMTEIPKNKVKNVIKKVQKKYEEADTSLKIFHEEGLWKMNPKEEYSDIAKKVVSEAELPRPVMETLAIIAYKSPVLQSEVTNIRGSGTYEHIGILEDKGFISREKHGRTYKIKLAEKFFDYFDVEGEKDIRELFKDIKKPDPEKIGNLEVYNSDENDEKFTQAITDRMKKVEKTDEDEKTEDDFLNRFDERLTSSHERIATAEKDLEEYKPKQEESEETEDTESAKESSDEDSPDFLKKINEDIENIAGEDETEEEPAEETTSEDSDEEKEKT